MPEMKNGFVRDVYNLDPSLPFREDADGNLVGRPTVTCIGVFPYVMEDGSIFNELRLPEEVFAPDTLNSMRLIPVTNDHPGELVTPDNIGKYQVGITGEDVCRADFFSGWDSDNVEGAFLYKTDGTQVTIPMKITERAAIDAVKAGKRGLSCGYTRDLELKSGVWNGIHYDGIQRNIRVNHVAICDMGRAGEAAVIRMDSADKENKTFVPTYTEKVADAKPADDSAKTEEKGVNKEGSNMPKKLTLDSATFEVDERVADAYEALAAERDALIKERDSLQGKCDAADAKIQSLETEMSGMIKADVLPEKVREYQEIKETADKFGVSLEDGMSVTDMKKAVLKVANPALADTIDSRSAEYIDGAFSLCQSMKPAPKSNDQNADSDDDNHNDDDKVSISDSVHNRLMKKSGR